MNRWRVSILVLGPLPIVAASFGLSRWARCEPQSPPSGNLAVWAEAAAPAPSAGSVKPDPALADECRKQADALREKLGDECSVLERPPFVLAGDMPPGELDDWHRRTVGPSARAMARSYFRTPPSRAILILLFSHESSYNHYARKLYGDQGISVYGYYKPAHRALVMNIDTGGGTLVHELTHALMAFDFPQVPDWLNEGLASLHEACHIRAEETALEGLPNWRLPGLQAAIRRQRLPSLERLVTGDDFRGSQVGLNYAQARYFCLYMQQQGVLEPFYREFRANRASDPTGAAALAEVFPGQSWDALDADFQAWALKLQYQP